MTESTGRSTPAPSLRERKKMAAMHRIQKVALEMIDERGYEWVTIEKIAAAAEVSPSTVYRYFGTKEGLVLSDAFDEQALAVLGGLLAEGVPPWEALQGAVDRMLAENGPELDELAPARVRLWFETPSVRAHALTVIDDAAENFAVMMEESGRWSRADARVIAASIPWPLIAAIRNWYEDGARGPWHAYIQTALDTARRAAADNP